jgi:hypothetical protein
LREFNLLVVQHQPAPESLVLAGFAVDFDAHVGFVVDAFLGRRSDRQFQGTKHDVSADILFTCQGIDQQQ